ncbi:unnamed protein product [Oikopleura dioica]|uniref:Uncharacterized protein n=1 Tax=Oikopleura dioica TaxID=34765 RepID=E4YR56_OIKDI|nr:unnamed protein product [Oikopleura dioica]
MKLFGLISAASALSRSSNPSCAEAGKPNFCKDVLTYTTRTNAWTCKDCFNIRVEINLNAIGAVGDHWDNRDHVFLAFDNDVSFIKVAGPGDNVVQLDRDDDGNQVWASTSRTPLSPAIAESTSTWNSKKLAPPPTSSKPISARSASTKLSLIPATLTGSLPTSTRSPSLPRENGTAKRSEILKR